MYRDVYSGRVKHNGEEDRVTLIAALNYAISLVCLKRFEEAKSLLRKVMPVAQRIFGESDRTTLTMRKIFAEASYKNPGAKLDDLREAVTTFEDSGRIARRVFGESHPFTTAIESGLLNSRAVLRERETMGDVSSLREAMEAMTPGGA